MWGFLLPAYILLFPKPAPWCFPEALTRWTVLHIPDVCVYHTFARFFAQNPISHFRSSICCNFLSSWSMSFRILFRQSLYIMNTHRLAFLRVSSACLCSGSSDSRVDGFQGIAFLPQRTGRCLLTFVALLSCPSSMWSPFPSAFPSASSKYLLWFLQKFTFTFSIAK